MHKVDVLALLSAIVGLSSITADAAFSSQLTALFGTHAPAVLAIIGLIGTVAAQALRIVGSPTQPTPPTPIAPVTIITPAVPMTNEVKNDAA